MLTQEQITDYLFTLDFEDYYDCCEAIEMAWDGQEYAEVMSAFEQAWGDWESAGYPKR